MPSSLHKVQKAISKKRGSKNGKSRSLSALHEDSRDAKRIRRAAARDDKVIRQMNLRGKQNEKYLTRLAFFHSAARTPALLSLPAPADSATQTTTPPSAQLAPPPNGGQDTTMASTAEADDESSSATLHHLIALYLSKHTSLLAQLESARRPGRPKTNEQVRAEHERDVERAEYGSGFWMPDLRLSKDRELFAEWDGRWEGLGPYTFVEVRRRDGAEPWARTVKGAKFPPGG